MFLSARSRRLATAASPLTLRARKRRNGEAVRRERQVGRATASPEQLDDDACIVLHASNKRHCGSRAGGRGTRRATELRQRTPCHELALNKAALLYLFAILMRTSAEHVLGSKLGAPPPYREALVLIVEESQGVVAELLGGMLLLHLVARPLEHDSQNKIQQHRLRRVAKPGGAVGKPNSTIQPGEPRGCGVG